MLTNITPQEFFQAKEQGKTIVVDVRAPKEFDEKPFRAQSIFLSSLTKSGHRSEQPINKKDRKPQKTLV